MATEWATSCRTRSALQLKERAFRPSLQSADEGHYLVKDVVNVNQCLYAKEQRTRQAGRANDAPGTVDIIWTMDCQLRQGSLCTRPLLTSIGTLCPTATRLAHLLEGGRNHECFIKQAEKQSSTASLV